MIVSIPSKIHTDTFNNNCWTNGTLDNDARRDYEKKKQNKNNIVITRYTPIYETHSTKMNYLYKRRYIERKPEIVRPTREY